LKVANHFGVAASGRVIESALSSGFSTSGVEGYEDKKGAPLLPLGAARAVYEAALVFTAVTMAADSLGGGTRCVEIDSVIPHGI
jgi:hypothetical protein